MRLANVCTAMVLGLFLSFTSNALNAAPAVKIGTHVLVVTGPFPPTKMAESSSGYTKPLVIHSGKRAVVVGFDAARKDLAIVKWDEQYWQEWTDPPVEDYVDSSRYFMNQTGKWIKWKSFTSAIHVEQLTPNLIAEVNKTPQ